VRSTVQQWKVGGERSQFAVLLVLLALLLFTTVRTSPIYAGPESSSHGSSLTKTPLKQRHLLATEFVWIAPILDLFGSAPRFVSRHIPAPHDDTRVDWFTGRCYDIPPPVIG
jgi:hypothetical protein